MAAFALLAVPPRSEELPPEPFSYLRASLDRRGPDRGGRRPGVGPATGQLARLARRWRHSLCWQCHPDRKSSLLNHFPTSELASIGGVRTGSDDGRELVRRPASWQGWPGDGGIRFAGSATQIGRAHV